MTAIEIDHEREQQRISELTRSQLQSLILDYVEYVKDFALSEYRARWRYKSRIQILQEELSRRNPPMEVRMPVSAYDDDQFTLGDNVKRRAYDDIQEPFEDGVYDDVPSIPVESIERAIKAAFKENYVRTNEARVTQQYDKLARFESQAVGMRILWAKIEELSGIELKGY